MFTRKFYARLRLIMIVVLWSLLLNSIVPIHRAYAAAISTATVPDSKTAVSEPPALVKEATPSLPKVSDRPVKRRLTVRASAYSSTPDQTDNDPFTTANGTRVHTGVVASNGLPFGAQFRIPSHYGSRVFTVEDRMNARWGGKRIDIWMTSRQAAKEWGVRTVTIELI